MRPGGDAFRSFRRDESALDAGIRKGTARRILRFARPYTGLLAVFLVLVVLAAIIGAVGDGSISRAQGREVLEAHVSSGSSAASIIEERGFRQISDASALGGVVDDVIAANPAAVADYRAGKAQAIGFLVGQVMKATAGQANAALVKETVTARLEAEWEGEG